ncbi:MAG: hypothetical protein KAT34_20465 [Candidatus Aminicenantes bacterium]|nr:hypothetical protein [Candidatus Aminicenantes bacterium]
MKNKSSILFIFTCIVVCFLLLYGGCEPRKFCPFPEDMDFEGIAPLSDNLQTDIYIDASFSMVGFVNPGNSYYARTLQLLERAIIAGWPKGSRTFYKFGAIINEISREQALEAAFRGFYCDPDFKSETRIESVIDNAAKDNLNIIVTDLFQMDADVNLLIEKLNQKFLSKEISVGVFGIKSQFRGRVWDVGLESLNFHYDTDGREPAEYRPFYLLILGKYNDIVHFYKMMRYNGLDSFQGKNFIIFSPQLVERLATFENSKIKPGKVTQVLKILENSQKRRHLKQFMVNNSSSEHYFESSIPITFLDHMVQFNPQKICMEISAWQWMANLKKRKGNTKKKQENPMSGKMIPSGEVLRAIAIKNIGIAGSQLKFKTEIDPNGFPEDGTYCFKIVFQSLSDSCSLPQWISGWDMDQNQISTWSENPQQFPGNTTLNLKSFLNNIWQIIYRKHKPKIAKLYFYIEKG